MKYVQYVLLVVVLIMVGCSDSATDIDAKTRNQILNNPTISWQECSDNATGVTTMCGSILVPRDYENDDSQYYVVGLVKTEAKDQENKIGTIFLNPGGPGGEGTLMMIDMNERPYTMPKQLRERFDFIGFDPRGVGSSTNTISTKLENYNVFIGKKCYETHIPDEGSILYQLNNDDLYNHLLSQSEFYKHCVKETSNNMLYTGTHNVVKDINQIRKALGEEKINYLGYSYGTRVGALLIQEYPHLVRAVVLDAPMHPSKDPSEIAIDNIQSYYDVFKLGYQKCPLFSKKCPSIDQIAQKFVDIEQKLIEFRDKDDNKVELEYHYKDFHFSINFLATYFHDETKERQQEFFDEFLEIYNKDINTMTERVIQRAVRKFPEHLIVDTKMLFPSVMCNDSNKRPTIADIEDAYKNLDNSNKNILFKKEQFFMVYGICLGFPISKPLINTHSTTNPKVVIISGDNDQATPKKWAKSLHENINSLYVKSNHIGHTISFGSKSEQGYNICSDRIITKYFLDLTLLDIDEIECNMTSREEIKTKYNIDLDSNESLISTIQDALADE